MTKDRALPLCPKCHQDDEIRLLQSSQLARFTASVQAQCQNGRNADAGPAQIRTTAEKFWKRLTPPEQRRLAAELGHGDLDAIHRALTEHAVVVIARTDPKPPKATARRSVWANTSAGLPGLGKRH
jgi:hypothetical protein